jgi:hypothetical protein
MASRERVPASAVNRVLVIGAVLVVLILFLWALTSGAIHLFGNSGDKPKAVTPSATTTRSPSVPTSAVQEGDLRFRVQAIRQNDAGNTVLTLQVQNVSGAFVSFYAEHQLLAGTVGKAKKTVRGMVALTTLEPHETAGVSVVFPVPAGFHADAVEVHASPGSTGKRMTLS